MRENGFAEDVWVVRDLWRMKRLTFKGKKSKKKKKITTTEIYKRPFILDTPIKKFYSIIFQCCIVLLVDSVCVCSRARMLICGLNEFNNTHYTSHKYWEYIAGYTRTLRSCTCQTTFYDLLLLSDIHSD